MSYKHLNGKSQMITFLGESEMKIKIGFDTSALLPVKRWTQEDLFADKVNVKLTCKQGGPKCQRKPI